MREFIVNDVFGTARGTIVVVDGSTNDLPVRRFVVALQGPDGTIIHTHATVEIPLRRVNSSVSNAAILIESIDRSQAPRGSIVRIV
jgi:hypothetical protein